jgi:hypothetical protein
MFDVLSEAVDHCKANVVLGVDSQMWRGHSIPLDGLFTGDQSASTTVSSRAEFAETFIVCSITVCYLLLSRWCRAAVGSGFGSRLIPKEDMVSFELYIYIFCEH